MLTEEPGRSPLYLLNVLRHPSEVAGQKVLADLKQLASSYL